MTEEFRGVILGILFGILWLLIALLTSIIFPGTFVAYAIGTLVTGLILAIIGDIEDE